MRYLSICSGIEAASVAWHSLGWTAVAFAEVERFPAAVLEHRFRDVWNAGDLHDVGEYVSCGIIEAPDVLVGGTPCQAFSVAGARRSLEDARGNLSLVFCELANVIDQHRRTEGKEPSIIVWENVPGVLSTKDNAFGCFLAGLAGEDIPLVPPRPRWSNAGVVLGPERTVAWRILDAQHFGLAQRRRRVFVVASARAGFDPATVLFEWDGVRRDTAPRREAREDTTGSTGDGIARCLTTGEAKRQEWETCNFVADIAPTLRAGGNVTGGDRPPGTDVDTCESLIAFDATQITSAANRSNPKAGDPCHPLAAGAHAPAIAFQASQSGVRVGDVHATLDANNGSRRHNGSIVGGAVRRLTPRECERLQGFPDDYTRIPWRGKPAEDCPDGPRYKALGNSMAVPVMRWVGERIARALR